MRITEEKLSAAIRAGKFDRLYFIYGKEPFLISMYTDRIIKKTVGEDAFDFDLQKFDSMPDTELLTDSIETLPVFSPVKVVTVKDVDPESFNADTDKKVQAILSDIPENVVLVMYCTSVEIDEKKAKTKKFLKTAEENGTVCCIELMKAPKIAELCVKKAAKSGIVMSPEDALYLTERVGNSMTAASDETAKLMSYVGEGGTITRSNIDALVPKQLDAEVFDLAAAINAGKRAEAYRIVDELFSEQIKPVNIMSALASAYLDMYCAKLARSGGMNPMDAAKAFGYFGGRSWAFTNKIMPAASRLETAYLRETVKLMSEADIALKSSPVDARTQIDEAVTKLFICRDKRLR